MEIHDICRSYYRKQTEEFKRHITHDFIMAEVKMRYLARDKDQNIPHPWEYYPGLFTDEKQMYEEQKSQEEFEAYKAAQRAYIEEFNRRRQQGQ